MLRHPEFGDQMEAPARPPRCQQLSVLLMGCGGTHKKGGTGWHRSPFRGCQRGLMGAVPFVPFVPLQNEASLKLAWTLQVLFVAELEDGHLGRLGWVGERPPFVLPTCSLWEAHLQMNGLWPSHEPSATLSSVPDQRILDRVRVPSEGERDEEIEMWSLPCGAQRVIKTGAQKRKVLMRVLSHLGSCGLVGMNNGSAAQPLPCLTAQPVPAPSQRAPRLEVPSLLSLTLCSSLLSLRPPPGSLQAPALPSHVLVPTSWAKASKA